SDTCASIAAAFNVTKEQLQERNHELKCSKALQIGQQVWQASRGSGWPFPKPVLSSSNGGDRHNTSRVCVVRGTADLPVCQEYVTVAEGDTCDTIMRSARPPLTSQEFYALNPGINCNVGEQSLLGQQICTRGGQSSVLLGASKFYLPSPLDNIKMAAMLTSSLCSSNPAARLFPSLKPALSANAVQALTSRYSHTPLQLSSCSNRSQRLVVVEASTANPSQISFATAVESQPTLFQAIDFKKLQNGSDIRGVAIPGVEGEPVTLTEPAAEAIGAAFARFLKWKKEQAGEKADGQLSVSIGHDSRVSADVITAAVARGLAGEGVKVVRFGLASTPAMFSSTVTEDASLHCPNDGGIMITASHLPFNRNGLKFFTAKGGANKADIAAILASAAQIYESMSAESVQANQEKAEKQTVHVDYMKRYAADLVDAVRKAAKAGDRPLEGYHIVVDAGNGAGGFFAAGVLEPLGANTSGSQFLEPDGLFPNHIPNPEDKAAMEAITGAVLREKADLGIIFDTDVDRAAAVDSSGKEINRNRLIALIAAIVLEEHPGTTIVTDSVTSDGLTTFIESKLGGKHLRFKRGYKNVIDEGIRLNSVGEECHLAMETSGHGALKENRWLDDGAYLMVKLLVKLASAAGKGEAKGSAVLTRMIEDLQEADEATEVRLRINQDHADVTPIGFRAYGEKVLEALTAMVESDAALSKAPVNYEGVRVSGFGGWFLLRLSLHDPVLPLNIEGPSKAATRRLAEAVVSVTSQFPALDTSALRNQGSSGARDRNRYETDDGGGSGTGGRWRGSGGAGGGGGGGGSRGGGGGGSGGGGGGGGGEGGGGSGMGSGWGGGSGNEGSGFGGFGSFPPSSLPRLSPLNILLEIQRRVNSYFAARPLRRAMFGGIALFGGFYVAQTISLSFGALSVNDVAAAAICLVFTEVVTRSYYSTLRPSFPLALLNVFKMGFTYGLFIDAFKLAS
ncbi:unnamed protein product, partial [Closterium sp. NIES-65]